MASPTSRTLEHMRERGYLAQVVEKWNPFAKIRQDLFGCIDIVAVREVRTHGFAIVSPGQTIGIQATSTGNIGARVKKSIALPGLLTWLLAGNHFWVCGWSKSDRKYRPHWTKIVESNGACVVRKETEGPS